MLVFVKSYSITQNISFIKIPLRFLLLRLPREEEIFFEMKTCRWGPPAVYYSLQTFVQLFMEAPLKFFKRNCLGVQLEFFFNMHYAISKNVNDSFPGTHLKIIP